MAFVLAIFLAIIFSLYCSHDRSKLDERAQQYLAEHPPCRCQEEYLLTSKLYHQYKLEGKSKDPKATALYDAGWEMIKMDATPMHFRSAGLTLAKQQEREQFTKSRPHSRGRAYDPNRYR